MHITSHRSHTKAVESSSPPFFHEFLPPLLCSLFTKSMQSPHRHGTFGRNLKGSRPNFKPTISGNFHLENEENLDFLACFTKITFNEFSFPFWKTEKKVVNHAIHKKCQVTLGALSPEKKNECHEPVRRLAFKK